jgi:hypothetical protein
LKKRDLLSILDNGDINHKMREFELWLMTNDDRKLLKSYAVRSCGAYMRDNIGKCVLLIRRKIWMEERDQLQENIRIRREFMQFSSTFSQVVNVVNNNEVSPGQILESVMSWIIDRTPDYTILERLRNPVPKKLEIIWEFASEDEMNKEECSICYEQTEYSNKVKLNCDHEFCGFCVKKIIEKNNQPCCALCRVNIDKIQVNSMNMECLFHDYKK